MTPDEIKKYLESLPVLYRMTVERGTGEFWNGAAARALLEQTGMIPSGADFLVNELFVSGGTMFGCPRLGPAIVDGLKALGITCEPQKPNRD